MSLTVSANSSGTVIEPVSQGTHLGVCGLLVDLGLQLNKKYNKLQPKVLIGWELPDQTYTDANGDEKPKMVYNRYTANLNEGSNLRRDLATWRGKDFTPDELDEFKLQNIVGKSCFINVIHNDYNGKVYANVSGIMALPKGVNPGKLSEPALVFDIDDISDAAIAELPKWIGDIVMQSEEYKHMKVAENQAMEAMTNLAELEDDGDLPF